MILEDRFDFIRRYVPYKYRTVYRADGYVLTIRTERRSCPIATHLETVRTVDKNWTNCYGKKYSSILLSKYSEKDWLNFSLKAIFFYVCIVYSLLFSANSSVLNFCYFLILISKTIPFVRSPTRTLEKISPTDFEKKWIVKKNGLGILCFRKIITNINQYGSQVVPIEIRLWTIHVTTMCDFYLSGRVFRKSEFLLIKRFVRVHSLLTYTVERSMWRIIHSSRARGFASGN